MERTKVFGRAEGSCSTVTDCDLTPAEIWEDQAKHETRPPSLARRTDPPAIFALRPIAGLIAGFNAEAIG